MSVRKDKRNQSKMDFFKYADRINEQVTRWLLTNFGEKKIKSDINHIIKDISMEDQKQITDIFNKYDIKSKYNEEGNKSSLSEIFDSLTKDKTGIFESQHKKVVIPSSGANSDSDDELQKIRENMFFPSAMNKK